MYCMYMDYRMLSSKDGNFFSGVNVYEFYWMIMWLFVSFVYILRGMNLRCSLTVDICYRYQMEVFEAAKKGNTIAHSEIGAENSLIAVMLIEEIAKSVKLSGRKRLIIFLAPTVGLVHQACF